VTAPTIAARPTNIAPIVVNMTRLLGKVEKNGYVKEFRKNKEVLSASENGMLL
jgi:hypothetical protein